MKRTPSLHISIDSLVEVLKTIRELDDSVKYNEKSLAKQILKRGKGLSITGRAVTISNQYQDRKVTKILKAGLKETNEFNRTLSMVRRTMKHRGIQDIKEGDRNWAQLKEVTKLAVSFCNDFGLDTKNGFTLYCTLAVSRMGKFSLNRFPALHEDVCLDHECLSLIDSDPNREITEEAHRYYCNTLFIKTGIPDTYENSPSKYVCFVRASEICKSKGIKITDYIDAQFDGLSWTANPPGPHQLIGDNAWHRFTKYAYSKNINLKTPKQEVNESRLASFVDKHRNEIFSD